LYCWEDLNTAMCLIVIIQCVVKTLGVGVGVLESYASA